MQILNNTGPSTEPCGTPNLIVRGSEIVSQGLIRWDLPLKKLENHFRAIPRMHDYYSKSMQMILLGLIKAGISTQSWPNELNRRGGGTQFARRVIIEAKINKDFDLSSTT